MQYSSREIDWSDLGVNMSLLDICRQTEVNIATYTSTEQKYFFTLWLIPMVREISRVKGKIPKMKILNELFEKKIV